MTDETSTGEGSAAESAATKGAASEAENGKKATVTKKATTTKKAPETRGAEGAPSDQTSGVSADDGVASASAEHDVATSSATEAALAEIPGLRLIEVNPAEVVPNPAQPRKEFREDDLNELIHSVREFGVLQPIVVRTRPEGGYELIMGERRLRASKAAELSAIPAIVRETADEDLLRDALLENLHRSNLNPLEEASAYQQLLQDFGITQDELAERIGRSRPQVSNTLRLLRLPTSVQAKVAAGVLSAGHARALLSLEGTHDIERVADKVINQGLSVRQTEELSSASSRRRTAPRPGKVQQQLSEVAERLENLLDTKVHVNLNRKKGQVVIDFATVSDLNRILRSLGVKAFGEE